MQNLKPDGSPLHQALWCLWSTCYLGLIGCVEMMDQDKPSKVLQKYVLADTYTQAQLSKAEVSGITLRALAAVWHKLSSEIRDELATLPETDVQKNCLKSLDDIRQQFEWVTELPQRVQ